MPSEGPVVSAENALCGALSSARNPSTRGGSICDNDDCASAGAGGGEYEEDDDVGEGVSTSRKTGESASL
jgi:hypothetical protein